MKLRCKKCINLEKPRAVLFIPLTVRIQIHSKSFIRLIEKVNMISSCISSCFHFLGKAMPFLLLPSSPVIIRNVSRYFRGEKWNLRSWFQGMEKNRVVKAQTPGWVPPPTWSPWDCLVGPPPFRTAETTSSPTGCWISLLLPSSVTTLIAYMEK